MKRRIFLYTCVIATLAACGNDQAETVAATTQAQAPVEVASTGLPALDLPIPADTNHIHFGDGSTSTEITLEPGEHTLQLLLGDHLHIPHEPPVASEVINITVE